ncbi:SpvB/TcaC N-terminal domain-containing protein [Pseudanabaena sp. ABRG5-3]|uniref:SpvB/TcaC N-terminal domain-containing protein n=1 Tax=Pseudanabaena sp. ABRG5-3 TaxID=685565 RepID=UPI000DC740D1|nr:hypothetical protein ABRG53_4232 [Pseudanabaena sp. ABRG5-3]
MRLPFIEEDVVRLNTRSKRTDWMFEVVFDYGDHYLTQPRQQSISVNLSMHKAKGKNYHD